MTDGLRETYSEDARLVARAQHGDQGAFRQLFEAHGPRIFRLVSRMGGSTEDAADLTQEIFIRAWSRLEALKDGQAFQAWLTRLAMNCLHDHGRRKRVEPLSLDAPPPGQADGSEWPVADPQGDCTARVLQGELSARLDRALSSLSADHRAVVILHHVEGYPLEEIAGILEVAVGTVKSRLARARAELRRKLEGYLEE
jgi:RNA polymerase sigma-70 factor (ECF subfamily)